MQLKILIYGCTIETSLSRLNYMRDVQNILFIRYQHCFDQSFFKIYITLKIFKGDCMRDLFSTKLLFFSWVAKQV